MHEPYALPIYMFIYRHRLCGITDMNYILMAPAPIPKSSILQDVLGNCLTQPGKAIKFGHIGWGMNQWGYARSYKGFSADRLTTDALDAFLANGVPQRNLEFVC